jgi:hypothetical protein
MALQTFKEVIQNKGYRISSKDRAIFEKENLQSFFGLSDSDVIEFVVYDARDNQLPQTNYGLIRYIKLSTQNIKDYILIPTGTLFQKYKFPKEYFIDVERLLKEAGYTNGIFKTQVTLLNKRVGSGDELNNKLWISEISPSRTEIRLFPLKKGLEEHADLQERFNIFVNDKNFREDTIYNISNFLEKVKADYITEFIKNKYTAKWFDILRAEFKITNFDEFATKIRNSFVQASEYEFSNRFSTIGQPNYGQVKSTKQNLDLSVSDIINTCKRILTEIINYYLAYPDAKTKTTFDYGFNASNDYVTSVLQRNESDVVVNTLFPVIRRTTILKGPTTPLDGAVGKEDPSKPTGPSGPVIVRDEPNPQRPSQPASNNPYDDPNADVKNRPRQPVGGPSRGNPNETDAFGNPTGGTGNAGGTGNTRPPLGGATSNPNEQDPVGGGASGGTTGGGTTRGGAAGGGTTGGGTTGGGTTGGGAASVPNPPYDDRPVIATPNDPSGAGGLGRGDTNRFQTGFDEDINLGVDNLV